MQDFEILANKLFFSNLSESDRLKNDVRDSMMNNCFGVAQDLRLRAVDWGFSLSEVKAPVYMQHCRSDDSIPLNAAKETAEMLPNCIFEIVENGSHFSIEELDRFIAKRMELFYR